ncbi:MAG: hypothetical protein M1823_002956 [Watsoniomyces obsoletus]|nr:MAG: hypothetical protein M1823_002956 [Watsoniomyces obsoletus]
MAKIKKAGGPKHDATLAPALAKFIEAASSLDLVELPDFLATFPTLWPFPRGDLHHWIPVLDRFDHVLDRFTQEYGLRDGPQAQPIARRVLLMDHQGSDKHAADEELTRRGYQEDGDRQLVEAVLRFSRLLLSHCGSRSLYASSSHLNALLNSTDRSIVHLTLRLGVCLAQRYHTSRARPVGSVQQLNMALLATHYSISLDRVQKLAIPFTRSTPAADSTTAATTTPTSKGKERAGPLSDRGASAAHVNANDLAAIIQRSPDDVDAPASGSEETVHEDWRAWAEVVVTFYPAQSESASTDTKRNGALVTPSGPDTPQVGQGARTAESWQPSSRRKLSATERSIAKAPAPPTTPELVHEHRVGLMRVLTVHADVVASTPVWKIMASLSPDVPSDTRYELLSRLRVAAALVGNDQSRQEILGIRIVAIMNLAYIYPEPMFQQKVLQQDTDEPRRLQLAQQLVELVHPSAGHQHDAPRWLQTLALGALEALAKYRTKVTDVSTALNMNVNHGVLFYILRKAIREMSSDDIPDDGVDGEEWRDALFSLLAYLPNVARLSGTAVSNGLLPIALEVLGLRSERAERMRPKLIDFLHFFIYSARDPFQALANAGGLDVLSALVADEVQTGYDAALRGDGVPQGYRNQFVDYELPFFQQQTLRRLFKFINSMMSSNGMTLDRLLRNLIDSPQLLGGMRLVMAHAKLFGSSIWSGAVDVMSNFIHNEPTSYAVIAEAGLTRTFLEAVSGKPIPVEAVDGVTSPHTPGGPTDNAGAARDSESPEYHPAESSSGVVEPGAAEDPSTEEVEEYDANNLATGILPGVDAIAVVPHAFGAICLNAAGMKLFRRSTALRSFFEIFRSPVHIQRMWSDPDLTTMLGNSMDELVRHHPQLKKDVVDSVLTMVKMVGRFCREHAPPGTAAANMPIANGTNSETTENGGRSLDMGMASNQQIGAASTSAEVSDVEMREADAEPLLAMDESQQLMAGDGTPSVERQQDTAGTVVDVTAKFLTGFLANNGACSAFIEAGGAEWVLDLALVPGLPFDFSIRSSGQTLARVVHMLVEQMAHLVLPSLVKRTQAAIDKLNAFCAYDQRSSLFYPLVVRGTGPWSVVPESNDASSSEGKPDAMDVGRSLVTALNLGHIMLAVFSQPMVHHRSSQTVFSHVNLADLYRHLVRSLSKLFRRCIIEDMWLQKEIPAPWRDGSPIRGLGVEGNEAEDILSLLQSYRALPTGAGDPPTGDADAPTVAEPGPSSSSANPPPATTTGSNVGARDDFKKSLPYRRFQTFRQLLRQTPSTIILLLHDLGKTLVTKRLSDGPQKWNAMLVADEIADTMVEHLNLDVSSILADVADREAYWILVLTYTSQLIFEETFERQSPQCLTLVLQSFKNRGGFDAITRLLEYFVQEAHNLPPEPPKTPGQIDPLKRPKIVSGIEAILTFFVQVVTPKIILEASQTVAMTSRERSRDKPDFFSPNQFLVELKMAVLPPVQALWDSTFIERASTPSVRKMVDVLCTVLDNTYDNGAFRRSDSVPRRGRTPQKPWKPSSERLERLVSAGHDTSLAREALYRCYDNIASAEEYCRFMERCDRASRNPVPSQGRESPTSKSRSSLSAAPSDTPARRTSASRASLETTPAVASEPSMAEDQDTMDLDVPSAGPAVDTDPTPSRTPDQEADAQPASDGGALLDMSIDNLLGGLTDLTVPGANTADPAPTENEGRNGTTASSRGDPETSPSPKLVTLDDLEEKRSEIRRKITELALDILNVHGDVTFELADLITAAVPSTGNVESIRTEIGETLVQSLMSLQMEDDFRPVGKKIAAYAHLLALILRDKKFYDVTVKELTSSLSQLLDFIKVFPDQSLEDSSPWISQILLIMEKLLQDDARPQQIKWSPPLTIDAEVPKPIAELQEPVVSEEHKTRLLNAILEVLPRIGKDSSLALSVVRVLVILSRNRRLATRLGEKRNLQRLFVMVKQLAGMTAGNLQGGMLMVLRNIIEDDDTIRQIMRSGIQAYFDTRTSSRQVDVTSYVRNLAHLVLRSPELFVEVTNELLKISKFDGSQRHGTLALKESGGSSSEEKEPEFKSGEQVPAQNDAGAAPTDEGQSGSNTLQPAGRTEESAVSRQSPVEAKIVVDNPDGVIHLLLCELLLYKEIDDKEPATASKTTPSDTVNQPSVDVEMVDTESEHTSASASLSLPEQASRPESTGGAPFKAEQHPIFVYRCFILQCLTELLLSYTRTKLEFISFSRKAAPQASSTKPRSGILNYLLNDLIPIGTLNQTEDVAFRKRQATSNWAMTTIVALVSKTTEKSTLKDANSPDPQDEPELTLIRKFVLEHALKAYKDTTASSDNLDVKYAKLLSLADLFNRMQVGVPCMTNVDSPTPTLYASQKPLAKLMLEKNFISSLTASIAEIDLNYPMAKRAVKYILRPLKQLTQSAVELSESSSLSSMAGQSEDDQISSASSVSEMDDDREETPDLFRNSTLGMFEPGREAESDSPSSEGEGDGLYDDEYGDEMDYEEEEEGDEEGMSDIEGLPGDVGLNVELVIDEEDGGPLDDPDESPSDDEDDDDEDEHEDGEDGDEDGASDDEDADENDGWEDDDEDNDEDMDDDEDHSGDINPETGDVATHAHADQAHENSLHQIVEVLGGEAHAAMLQQLNEADLDMDLDPEGFMEDDMQEDEDISEEEDEDDDYDEDDEGMYAGAYDVPTYRSHRPAGTNSRGNDDGTHPLLQRSADNAGGAGGIGSQERDELMSDWIHALELGARGRGLFSADIPSSLINNLINAIGQSGATLGNVHRHGGALHFHVSGPPPRLTHRDGMPTYTGRPSSHVGGSPSANDPSQAINFVPVVTQGRWHAECRLLFGSEVSDLGARLANTILSVLVPPAIEEEKKAREKLAAEEERKAKEENERQAEEERAAAKKLEEEQEERRLAAEREAESNANDAEGTSESNADQASSSNEPEQTDDASPNGDSMEGVEATQTEPPATEAAESGTSTSAARVRTTIRGRELDITGMDIDPEYLDALPEELREEVLMHQIAERRSQATSSGEQPTNISREFLEALPADIREELLEQEAQDRRRREREEARRQAAANNGPAQTAGEDMDPASVLATLDPSLRQAILMEQDEDVLAQLPQEIAAEARALGSEHRLRHHFMDPSRLSRSRGLGVLPGGRQDPSGKKNQRKTVVQMLDKAGIATLLRLMFIPQQGSARHALNGILQNICENKQNRIETVSLLLSILQDGSADIAAIDRSFAQLSLRARQTGLQKSVQTPKRPQDQLPHAICEISPLAVVQQCLNTLVLLVQYNPHLQTFFLIEHEAGMTLKRALSKKGKMKENRASRYPLNSLLGLLDRKLVMESPTVMEQLSTLLNSVTQPLNMLLRKEKDQTSAEPTSDEAAVATTVEVSAPDSTSAAQPQTPTADGATSTTAETAEAVPLADPAAPQDGPSVPTDQDSPSKSGTKDDDKAAEDAKAKKERALIPPYVPDNNLRLVVNILTARECSAKTFRDTLSTVNNLSAIPGSRKVFGSELLRQAQTLGQSILQDLNDLTKHIATAHADTDVHGLALVKFSPSSSSQAKLLRVLTALDYLFDPEKEGGKTSEEDGKDAESSSESKSSDLLATLSDSHTFRQLWAKLSDCLSAIRQKEPVMVNLATILLPLIETLMVVCKNTTLGSSSNSQRAPSVERQLSAGSKIDVASSDGLGDLFFRFTEEHRKILNELVRHNPKLMSGTFSLLIKNPKVLEFDNKRNYFNRRLHTRLTETRHTQTPLQVSVRRDHVFLDSFKALYFKSGDEMKYGKLSVRFHGEEGVDAGGVTREWFQVLSRQMFNPDYALFTPVAADRTTFHPNRLSAVNPEHFMFFKFVGRIIGKALYEGRVLDCHFSRAVYKRILGKPVSVKDMETLDLDYYKSLIWMLENDITDIITETFSVETEAFGETQIIDLKENGRHIPVTEQNKQEYVRLVVEYRLTGSVQEQLEHFLLGFHDIVPAPLIAIFNEQELELLISGLPDIDVDDWKNNTEYHNYTPSSPQIQWFWRAVRSFDKEERAKLLQFVTGTSKVPLNGFKELEGMNGFSRFNIHRDYGSKERLPSSHTCFNQLDLPEYDSYESLRSHVYTAMTAGSDYFGFA